MCDSTTVLVFQNKMREVCPAEERKKTNTHLLSTITLHSTIAAFRILSSQSLKFDYVTVCVYVTMDVVDVIDCANLSPSIRTIKLTLLGETS